MKLKFGHKVFLTFIVNGLVIIVGMVLIFRFYLDRNFEKYIDRVEEERLDGVAEALAREYRRTGTWTSVVSELDHWSELRGLGGPGPHRGPLGVDLSPPPSPPDFVPGMEKDPPPPRPPQGMGPGGRAGPLPLPEPFRGPGPPGLDGRPGMPPRGPGDHDDGGPHGPAGRPGWAAPHLVLLDAQKRPLTQKVEAPDESFRMRSIDVDGKIVGWVGMERRRRPLHPVDIEFLKAQSQTLYTVGGLTFLLAVMMTVIFSRNILAPVKELARGTRALMSRRFETRIKVRSGDEFGRLARDFNEMARALERFEEMRRQWMADISHELRTPLAILRGEIEAMQDGVREMTPEALESLHAEIEHVSRIVNDLHDLSLIESRRGEEEWRPVALDEVLRATVKSFELRLERKGLKVSVETPGGAEGRIMADPFRLTQLFANLLENALRYSVSPGTLSIRHHVVGDRVEVTFEDSGPGVPEESLGKLFDRLYRVDRARSRASGGSGLGLAICKSIVESFGGRISAANGTWGGLRLTMDFPVLSRKKTISAMGAGL